MLATFMQMARYSQFAHGLQRHRTQSLERHMMRTDDPDEQGG